MMNRSSASVALLLITCTAACVGQQAPPPGLTITSPKRALMQDDGHVTVTGTTKANTDGDPVTRVTVNGQPATLSADGSFTADIAVPSGASIIETIAYTDYGGMATDARAVQSGRRTPVGANISNAVLASLSPDAFAKLSAAAGPFIKTLDLPARLAPLQPMASYSSTLASVQLSVNQLTFDTVNISLVPTDAGLMFNVDITNLDATAFAQYAVIGIPGSSMITVQTNKLSVSGVLSVTPNGTSGFTAAITTPQFTYDPPVIGGEGLAEDVVKLLNDHAGSTVEGFAQKAVESAMTPLLNDALGALSAPRTVNVLDHTITLAASPAAISFSHTGASVMVNLQTQLAGDESSPGFVPTVDGMPTIDPAAASIQVGLSDNLANEAFAELQGEGLFDLHVQKDLGIIDTIDAHVDMPPMVTASGSNGMMQLVLGDMETTFSKDGKPVVSAAINAVVEVAVARGNQPDQIALQFGEAHVWVNIIDNPATGDGSDGGGVTAPSAADSGAEVDVSGAAAEGIDVQLTSMTQFFVNVPIPAVAGVQVDSLAARADSGYLVVSAQIH